MKTLSRLLFRRIESIDSQMPAPLSFHSLCGFLSCSIAGQQDEGITLQRDIPAVIQSFSQPMLYLNVYICQENIGFLSPPSHL